MQVQRRNTKGFAAHAFPIPAVDSRPKLWSGMHFISSSCLALLEIGSQAPHEQP